MLAAEGLAMLADRESSTTLRSALPALRRASAFWKGNSNLVRQSLRKAILRIGNATASFGQLPLPAIASDDVGEALPRVPGEPLPRGPFPQPAAAPMIPVPLSVASRKPEPAGPPVDPEANQANYPLRS
jgi:hypothetical protein